MRNNAAGVTGPNVCVRDIYGVREELGFKDAPKQYNARESHLTFLVH